jgi:hypothetical protein
MHGRDEECKQNINQKAEGKIPLEDLGIDGRIILK